MDSPLRPRRKPSDLSISTHWQNTKHSLATSATLTLMALLLVTWAEAQTFTTLYNFTGGSDGAAPFAGVARDKAGRLYGTTLFGGTSGYGVVYKLNPSGNETVLHTFKGPDGKFPEATLTSDAKGNLYGATSSGGSSGNGTVFKITTTGKETVLHSFTGGTDGCDPFQGLVVGESGTVFGTTSGCGSSGHGTIFKIDSAGKFSILHSFAGSPSDGSGPQVGHLTMDTQGNLYGLTIYGGANGAGALYKLSKKGTLTLLYSFTATVYKICGATGTVVRDKNGNLYGTTQYCGSNNAGTVWKVNRKGKETILYNFVGQSDGCWAGGVTRDPQGNLYGTAWACGANNAGTLWEVSADGRFTLLHSFNSSGDLSPDSDLWRTNKGELFGTTSGNGYSRWGTVWSYVP